MLQTRRNVFRVVPKCPKKSNSDAWLSERTCFLFSWWNEIAKASFSTNQRTDGKLIFKSKRKRGKIDESFTHLWFWSVSALGARISLSFLNFEYLLFLSFVLDFRFLSQNLGLTVFVSPRSFRKLLGNGWVAYCHRFKQPQNLRSCVISPPLLSIGPSFRPFAQEGIQPTPSFHFIILVLSLCFST